MEQSDQTPNRYARVTGIIYLFYFLTAFLALFLVKRNMPVFGNIVNVLSIASYVAVTLRLYYLFKPVNKIISLIAGVLSCMGCVFTILDLFYHHARGIVDPLIFFAPYCILLGYLILRSHFLPQFLGVLLILAGIGWLVLLSHPGQVVSLCLKLLGFFAELLLMVWLMVKGVAPQRRTAALIK